MTPTKQKLTLSVDAVTIARARESGINISELTEKVLRAFTFKPEAEESLASLKLQDDLLKAMEPLVTRYHLRVPVGRLFASAPSDVHVEKGGAYLVDRGKIEAPGFTGTLRDEEEREFNWFRRNRLNSPENYIEFYPPSTILGNLIAATEKARSTQKKGVTSLVLARRIIDAITEQDDSDASPATLTKTETSRSKARSPMQGTSSVERRTDTSGREV